MQPIRVVIPDATAAKLQELASREFRSVRQQAAALLSEAVDRAAADDAHRTKAQPEREPVR